MCVRTIMTGRNYAEQSQSVSLYLSVLQTSKLVRKPHYTGLSVKHSSWVNLCECIQPWEVELNSMLPLCELCLETDFQRVDKGRVEKWFLWSMETRAGWHHLWWPRTTSMRWDWLLRVPLTEGSKSGALPPCPKPWSRHEKNEEKIQKKNIQHIRSPPQSQQGHQDRVVISQRGLRSHDD